MIQNMTLIKTFAISSELFSFYEKEVDLDLVDSVEEIIIIVESELNEVFQNNNLTILCDKLAETRFHIHDFTIEDMRKKNSEKKYYICDHC